MGFPLVLLFLVIGTVIAEIQEITDGCRLEDLDICNDELRNLEIVQSIYKASLCTEHFEVWKCLNDYSERCVPEEEMEYFRQENFEPLQTKIINLCTKVYEENEKSVEEEHDDPAVVQKALECLRETDKAVGECVSDVVSDVILAALEDDGDNDFFNRTDTQCMTVTRMADCIFDTLQQKCEEAVASAVRAGVEEELRQVMEGCAQGVDGVNLFYSVK